MSDTQVHKKAPATFTAEDRAKGVAVRRAKRDAKKQAEAEKQEQRELTRAVYAELRKMGIQIAADEDVLERNPDLVARMTNLILVNSLALVTSGEPEFQPKNVREAMQVAGAAAALSKLYTAAKSDTVPVTPEQQASKLAEFREVAKARAAKGGLTIIEGTG